MATTEHQIPVDKSSVDATAREINLGPRKLEDLLSEAFRIYKSNYTKLWAIAAITAVINTIVFVGGYALGFLLSVLSETDIPTVILPYVITGGTLAVIGAIIIGVWAHCALIYFVAVQYHDKDAGFADSYGRAWSRLGTAIGLGIVQGLVLGGLTLTIIGIPFAIYLGVRWCFALPYVMIDGSGITKAFSKSYALVKDSWWRVLGVNLAFAAIMYGINSVAALIPILGFLVGSIVSTPIVVLGLVLLYFDLRVRKQEYTLDDLTKELNIGSRP